jgi:hypothetical protein
MSIFSKPLESVTAEDILQICSDQISEGVEFELKSDLPTRDGRPDTWHTGDSFGDYARNEVAEEVIAFANTLGGVVCVGINETTDHPKRADTPHPLPRVHDLARRLRQAVYAIIDPPLPILEAAGVSLENDAGVVLLRVPASRRRPHRHTVSKEVFTRRNDESVRVTMREIQELTMQAVSEATKVEVTISERRKKFRERASSWVNAKNASGAGLHVLGVPTIPMDLGRVVGRPRLISFTPTVIAKFQGNQDASCVLPWRITEWRPGLRSITGIGQNRDSDCSCSLHTNGTCELKYIFTTTEPRSGAFVGWFLGALGFMLAWMDRIRNEAGLPVEFACAIQIPIMNQAIAFLRYGATSFAESDGVTLPTGFHEFPLISIGTLEEFPAILQRFDEDLWNLAGYDVQRMAPNFSIELIP